MEPGALVGAAAALSAGALVVALLVLTRAGRAARERREALAADLARSRADVDALSRRVADLADELRESRQEAANRGYVITSLGGETHSGDARALQMLDARLLQPRRPRIGRFLEDRLVGRLRRGGIAGSPGRLGDVAVRVVAVGHGVRRALAPDVLDRAVAESQVARRRSRRTRRKELRDARRLLRSVSSGSSGRSAGSASSVKAQDVA